MSPDFRAAVVLCDIEGLSYEEVAATLDVKLGTVRSRIHRGRAQLRAALAHRDPSQRPVTEPIDRPITQPIQTGVQTGVRGLGVRRPAGVGG